MEFYLTRAVHKSTAHEGFLGSSHSATFKLRQDFASVRTSVWLRSVAAVPAIPFRGEEPTVDNSIKIRAGLRHSQR